MYGDLYDDVMSLDCMVSSFDQLCLDPNGMWRNMFVTQPPCKKFAPLKGAGWMIPDDVNTIRDEGERLGMADDEHLANGWGIPVGRAFGCVNEQRHCLNTSLKGFKAVTMRDGKVVRE